MAAIARAGSGRRQELESLSGSSIWACRGPSTWTTFHCRPRPSAGSWVKATGTQAGTNMRCWHHRWWLCLLNPIPAPITQILSYHYCLPATAEQGATLRSQSWKSSQGIQCGTQASYLLDKMFLWITIIKSKCHLQCFRHISVNYKSFSLIACLQFPLKYVNLKITCVWDWLKIKNKNEHWPLQRAHSFTHVVFNCVDPD